ncbi:hypothetical protein CEXT_90731 [Caerostris extrusa]|uniref:Uncharacterized protein n=1 Tax=Caerostris extrusa TaxID=172846 RepID=A0AAV4P6J3_CAEEX|nr:hypothetical protein CEXT_90731 [Caerostris extrusa]
MFFYKFEQNSSEITAIKERIARGKGCTEEMTTFNEVLSIRANFGKACGHVRANCEPTRRSDTSVVCKSVERPPANIVTSHSKGCRGENVAFPLARVKFCQLVVLYLRHTTFCDTVCPFCFKNTT